MRKSIYICMIMAFIATFSSCNKWLDAMPASEVSSTDMFKSEKGFQDALIGTYMRMRETDVYGTALTIKDVELIAQHFKTSFLSDEDADFAEFGYGSNDGTERVESLYAGLYNVIVQANAITDKVEEKADVFSSETMRNMVEAEALSIRAYCHLDVLRLFGQLPNNATKEVSLVYMTHASKTDINFYAYAEYVKLLEADLEKAASLLKDIDPLFTYSFSELDYYLEDDIEDFYRFRRYRMNYYSIKALQARFYNYIGEKTKAYDAAISVISAKNADGSNLLELGGNTEFSVGLYNLSSEALFAFNYGPDFDDDVYEPLFGEDGTFAMEGTDLVTLFAGKGSTNNRADKLWGAPASYEYPYELKKYYQPEELTNDYDYIPYYAVPGLRLSECYLIAMENTTSLDDLNSLYIKYMAARDENVSGFSMLEEFQNTLNIEQEYRIEFFGEGQMFYTYKRFGEENMLWYSEKVTEELYVLPLPSGEVDIY